MQDLESAIHFAWHRVRPALLDDPHDLARRLARRRTPTLTRPPRAWCLALRASDARLPRSTTRDPQSTVEITATLLKKICASVNVYREFLNEAAAKLGATIVGLTNARIKSIFAAQHYPLLGGRRGKPIPLLTSQRPLDPNARLFAQPDPAWIWTAHLISRIPRDLHVTLTRIPHFRGHVSKHRYDELRHPELDDAPRSRTSRRLPPPQPDYVWYKWSRSGYFLGDDPSNWRNHPSDLGERPPRYRKRSSLPLPPGEGWGEGDSLPLPPGAALQPPPRLPPAAGARPPPQRPYPLAHLR